MVVDAPCSRSVDLRASSCGSEVKGANIEQPHTYLLKGCA